MMGALNREWGRFKGRVIYSSYGLAMTWREEHSFRFWAYMNVASATLAFALPLELGARVLVLALGVMILAMELMNTAVERVVNHLSPGQHPLAKAAKDAGSAAVAMTAMTALIAWIGAVWPLF